MIVHPSKCFKPFYLEQFVNQISKITKNNIFWHFKLYINTYVCILTGLQVLRFLCKPSLTMLCSSLKHGGIFSPKRATKKAFHGGDFWEKFMGHMEGLMIRSYQGRGGKMHFPIIFKSINCKYFPQPCCDTVFECLLKRNSLSYQTLEIDRYKELQ